MYRKILTLTLGLIFLVCSPSWGAQQNFQQIMRDNTEMRKSIVWLMDGLSELSKSKDKKLLLQADQKKKIFPVFQTLVKAKILSLTADRPNRQNGAESGQRYNSNGSASGQGQRWNMDPNDLRMQERIKKMEEQTALGTKQADRIDGILTDKQVGFIDNLNFDAKKYGFLEFRGMGGSQTGSQSQSQGQFQRPDPQMMAKIRGQMQAGRQNLIKLCQNVEKMLKSK